MKIRTSFVANSSSSSFICAIGYIEDEQKFEKWRRKFKDYLRVVNFVENETSSYDRYDDLFLSKDGKTIKLETYCDNTLMIPYIDDIVYEKNLVILETTGNENKESFWNGDTYDYDIDLNHFDDKLQKIYNEISETEISGVTHVDKFFGAGMI